MNDDIIYLDHAAATPTRPEVVEAMLPYMTAQFFNPSSHYDTAQQAAGDLDWAHETVAGLIGARAAEIIFTGGGSESDNLAIKGVARAARKAGKGNHIITAATEHHAVLHAAQALADDEGFDLTILPVDAQGFVDPATVAAALTDKTVLVSVMLANNEVGTIQPIRGIAAITRARRVPFHTDAVQAAGALPIDVRELGVDLLTLAGHKFYGPKGVGVLYARRGTLLQPLIHGGHQERDRRAGTENVAGAVGFAVALQLTVAEQPETVARIAFLRDKLVAGILASTPGARLTGTRDTTRRLPGSASFVFEGVQGEAVLLALEMRGILCSSGSACAAGETEPSHVLTAMGYPPELAHTAVRFTLGRDTTEDEIDRVIQTVPEIVSDLSALAA